MALVVVRDVEEFAGWAAGFLGERLERNVLATVLHNVRYRGGYGATPPLFAIQSKNAADKAGRVTAVAIRTPPWPMLAAGFATQAQADGLLADWLIEDPALPGVSGEPDTASAIAAAWRAQTGGRTELEFTEAMHSLTQVIEPHHRAPGRLRAAKSTDRDLLVTWERAFAEETALGDKDQAEPAVARRLEDGLQTIWETTEPVCTVGFATKIEGTVRIGPVYTPPPHRNHGYATAAVAATSRQLLAGGAERCMLFTDLANPVSNRIYAAIGYVRFAEWEQHRFVGPKLPN